MTFDRVLLVAVWNLTLILACGSIAILAILTVQRAMSTRRARLRAKRQSELAALLNALLQSPVPIDVSSLPGLQRSDFPIVLDLALDMIRSVKGAYVDEIVAHLSALGLFPYLVSLLQGAKRSQHLKALTLLGYFPPEQSRELLLAHVRDDDPDIQMNALRGLARHAESVDATSVLGELKESLQTNALILADVLRKFGTSSLPALHELARAAEFGAAEHAWAKASGRTGASRAPQTASANQAVRVAAITAIGKIGALASRDALLALLQDRNPRIRGAAAQALGRLGDDSTAKQVAALLRDSSDEVRVQSARALGSLRTEAVLTDLDEALDDESWWVRFRAAQSLVAFGDTGIALLKARCAHEDRRAEIARQILAEMVEP